MSGEFDSRKDIHSTKLAQRPQIFVKLSSRELCDSKFSGLHPFDNMAIIHCVKNGKKGKVDCETPILEIIFVTLIENSSLVTNDTQGPQKYPFH